MLANQNSSCTRSVNPWHRGQALFLHRRQHDLNVIRATFEHDPTNSRGLITKDQYPARHSSAALRFARLNPLTTAVIYGSGIIFS